MTDDLAHRVQRLEDRFALQDLLVHYAVLLDDRRFDEVSSLFTADGVFSSPNSRTVGREAIARNFEVKHDGTLATWHDPHASAVHFVDDDHARGTVIGYAELAWPDRTVVTSIRYLDDYTREADGWKFASRHVLSVYGLTTDAWLAGEMGLAERKRWPGRPVAAAELPDVEQRFPGYLGRW